LVGLSTALIYLFVYTPLKRVTWLNTLVGAVAGALPPVIGWAAARHDLSAQAWVLFAVQFCWQIPHFLAIAWLYRDEYAAAGFAMLPVTDRSGRMTGPVAVAGSIGAGLGSLLPVAAGWAGASYLGLALVMGGALGWFALQFRRRLTTESARQLFLASIVYLPLVFAFLVWGKGKP
jgi:heme o synthase